MNTADDGFETQYRKARAHEVRARATEPRAARAHYHSKSRRLVIELTNGVTLAVPPALLDGLHRADARKLAAIEITPDGYGLHWPLLDADFSVMGLVAGTFGSRLWMRELAALGGRARTPAKAVAARRNGRLGGRPRRAAHHQGRSA